VQNLFGRLELDALDGELILGDPTAEDVYRKTNSAVMTEDGTPDVKWYVFDKFVEEVRFHGRLAEAFLDVIASKNESAIKHLHIIANSLDDLLEREKCWREQGYEGLMIRSRYGPYKQNRSTLNEGYLLKFKRFVDGEAVVLDFKEQLENRNEAKLDERGYQKRSSHKANKVGKGTLGSFWMRDLVTGVEFKCALGNLKEKEAHEIWDNREKYLGEIARYKSFPVGVKIKPRHPEFTGWREKIDLC
jgi:DNA ligase-1